jgi:ABC-type histidine transport system ATPase subunit
MEFTRIWKSKVIRILKQPSIAQIMIDKNNQRLWNTKYLGSMIKNDVRCTREIKSRIFMASTAFNKKNPLFTNKLKGNLRKRLIKSNF